MRLTTPLAARVFRSDEIRILDSSGAVARLIELNEADRTLYEGALNF
jgi:hypothetical protein